MANISVVTLSNFKCDSGSLHQCDDVPIRVERKIERRRDIKKSLLLEKEKHYFMTSKR